MSRIVRHHQGAMRGRQDPFAQNPKSITQVGLKVLLEIERDRERHREVLCRNDHGYWHGRNRAKVSSRQIYFQQPSEYLILGAYGRRRLRH